MELNTAEDYEKGTLESQFFLLFTAWACLLETWSSAPRAANWCHNVKRIACGPVSFSRAFGTHYHACMIPVWYHVCIHTLRQCAAAAGRMVDRLAHAIIVVGKLADFESFGVADLEFTNFTLVWFVVGGFVCWRRNAKAKKEQTMLPQCCETEVSWWLCRKQLVRLSFPIRSSFLWGSVECWSTCTSNFCCFELLLEATFLSTSCLFWKTQSVIGTTCPKPRRHRLPIP